MNQAHADMDEMGEWAESHPSVRRAHHAHRAPVLTDRPRSAKVNRHPFIPQGIDQQGRYATSIPPQDQGWPARRCTVEPIEHRIDRMQEEFDEDQGQSADREVFSLLLKWLIVALSVCFCAWVVAGGADAYVMALLEAVRA